MAGFLCSRWAGREPKRHSASSHLANPPNPVLVGLPSKHAGLGFLQRCVPRTLIRRFRHVRHPVFVLRFTSFLFRPPESILFGSPGSWYRICALWFIPICPTPVGYPVMYCPTEAIGGIGDPMGACGMCDADWSMVCIEGVLIGVDADGLFWYMSGFCC